MGQRSSSATASAGGDGLLSLSGIFVCGLELGVLERLFEKFVFVVLLVGA